MSTVLTTAADIIALLVKAPRTAPELAQLASTTPATAKRWLNALADEGLIERDGARGCPNGGPPARVWKWVAR